MTVLFLRTSLAVLVEPAAPYQCTSLEVFQTFAFRLLVLVMFTWKLCVCVCVCVCMRIKEVGGSLWPGIKALFKVCALEDVR